MGKKRKKVLAEYLLSLRSKLLAELAEELGEHFKPDFHNRMDQIIETGDSAQLDVEMEINLRILEIKSTELKRLDHAVVRLESGDYGICQECGKEISEKRLQVLPFAELCFHCQEKAEKQEERNSAGRSHSILLSSLSASARSSSKRIRRPRSRKSMAVLALS